MREFLRKTLSGLTIAATMVWSIGLTAFVPSASAATIVSGSLIKASMPAVYYYGANGKRYVFPNEKTYKTWYPDFSGVITITDAELASIAIGGNVTYRPGVKLVKIQTDPKTYAVSHHGTLRWVQTEAIATALYGSTWNLQTDDIPDAFFAGNYTIGSPIAQASDYNRAAELAAASSINADLDITPSVVPPPSTNGVTASLATSNPAGATVPKAATGVTVLTFSLTGNGAVTNLTFKDFGIGSASDIAAAYLYDGNTRLTAGKSFNTTTKEASFNVNLAIAGTRTFSLVIDFSATAVTFGQHQFGLTAINGVPISGVVGNTFTVGAESVSTVTIDKTSTPINPTVGQIGAELANFKLTGGVNDTQVNRITFTQTGSIDAADLTNFVLKQGTTTVATAASMTNDKIVLAFSTPFSLVSGAVRNFTLYGNVAGRPGRTIVIYVDEASDVNITDLKYGFPAAIQNNFGAGNAVTLTTQGGALTIAFNGPTSGDISKGSQDADLFDFSLTAAAPMTIRNTYVTINGVTGTDVVCNGTNNTVNTFSDIKIINKSTGQVVAGPTSYTCPTGGTPTTTGMLTLTDDFDISGTTQFAITVDVVNDTSFNGKSYRVTLGNTAQGVIFIGGSDVKYQNSNDFVAAADIVPNTPIVGNTFVVRSSALTVGLSSAIGDNTSVKGASDVQAVAFSLSAGSDSLVKITKFIVNPRADLDQDGTYSETAAFNGSEGTDENANAVIASAKLWRMNNDSSLTLLSGPKGVVGTLGAETITFDNFSDTIAAGQSTLYIVSLTFTTTAASVDADTVAVTIQASANITAEDKDNNTVSAVNAVGGAAITAANALNDSDASSNVNPTVQSDVIAVGTFGISSDTSDTTYKSRLVQMGTTNNKSLRLKARGTSEAFKVTDLEIDANNSNNVTSVTITYPIDAAQVTMESRTSTFTAGAAVFTGMNWYVTKDNDSYASVTAQVNTDVNGASSVQSGAVAFGACSVSTGDGSDSIILCAQTENADINAAGPTKVLGLSSGTYADNNNTANADSVSNTLYARKTLITITKDAASPSGTGFVPGVNEYLRFKVANSSGSTAVISQLTFTVSGSDSTPNDWACGLGATSYGIKIFDVNDQATDLADIAGAGSYSQTDAVGSCAGAGADTVSYVITLGSPISVSPSSSRTFIMKTDTTGASSSNDDSFRVDVTNSLANGTVDAADGSGSALQWSDGINTENGWKVEQLPVTGGNIQF